MLRFIGLLLPVGLTAACGDAIDPTTGGEGSGETGFSIIITDDPANEPSPLSASIRRAIDGEMTGAIRVSLRNDEDDLVELGIMQDVEIPLQAGSDSLRLTDLTRPPADDYVGIQLRFEGAQVRVLSGSEVGDSTLTSNVVLEVGTSGSLATVEVGIPSFSVDSDSEVDIVVDLNSELWITQENVNDTNVPQADLASAVSVEIP